MQICYNLFVKEAYLMNIFNKQDIEGAMANLPKYLSEWLDEFRKNSPHFFVLCRLWTVTHREGNEFGFIEDVPLSEEEYKHYIRMWMFAVGCFYVHFGKWPEVNEVEYKFEEPVATKLRELREKREGEFWKIFKAWISSLPQFAQEMLISLATIVVYLAEKENKIINDSTPKWLTPILEELVPKIDSLEAVRE